MKKGEESRNKGEVPKMKGEEFRKKGEKPKKKGGESSTRQLRWKSI